MNGNDFIPGTVEGFKSYSDKFMNTLGDIGAEDLMPPPVYHEFVRLWDDYGKKYAVSENRDTRTTVTIFERDEAQALFEKELRRIIKSYIAYNLKFAEKKSEVKFTTFVVRKIRFNRLAEVNYISNRTSKSIGGIRLLLVKLKDTDLMFL